MNKGQQFFDKMRNSWEQRSGHSSNASTEHKKSNWSDFSHQNSTQKDTDWDYNARKHAEQAEIDRILDKIRKSGYDSLTKEEKQKLFDSSKHN